MKYTLIDGVQRNKEHPNTFYIPSEKDKKKVTVGLLCKLGFEPTEDAEEIGGERMWVEVISADGDNFVGTLRNMPLFMPIEFGEEVAFNSKHIIDITEDK